MLTFSCNMNSAHTSSALGVRIVAERWNPICRGSLTAFVLNMWSPLLNSSAEPLARHE